jgi:hypothetical protein
LFHLIEILDPISLWEGFNCMVKQDRHGRHLPPVVGFICLWRIVLSTSAFNFFLLLFCCHLLWFSPLIPLPLSSFKGNWNPLLVFVTPH